MKKGTFYQKGITELEHGVQFVFKIEEAAKEIEIVFFAGEKELERVSVPEECRQGQLYSVILDKLPKEADSYCYYADKKFIEDFYARAVVGLEEYGREKGQLRYLLPQKAYAWEADVSPAHTYEKSVVYGLHVRGFTKHTSSGVKKKGTFAGIREKIPYLTELGVTAVELMPAYEFDEVEKIGGKYQKQTPELKTNYWGFKQGYYYAPKSSYAAGADAITEMKDMVKALHKAGIEIIMQFYFPGYVNCSEIPEILRFWVSEYHIDGFRLLGERIPTDVIGEDPLLKGTKLIGNDFGVADAVQKERQKEGKHIALWKYDFTYDIRKALKGDEGCMSAVLSHLQDNPNHIGAIHAIAGYDGFTLNDLVSYERKHNEDNGEDNKDGSDYNCSWNCGVEGKTRKRTIQLLRRKQMKNALALVMLSQGTPYLQSGDEFCRTQGGNNNPYCQDNEMTWVDWKLQKTNRDFYDYTRALIAFRKAHAVFHREQRLRGLDYLGCGCPDISFHGEEAWKPVLESYSRHVGVMYSGKYAMNDNRQEDADFYVAINMHWETHEFALPKLAKNKQWQLCMDTAMPGGFVCSDANDENVKKNQTISGGSIVAAERSVMICMSVEREAEKPEKKENGKSEKKQGK